jgi:CRISPR/Cas system CMR subunit Cmr4 (Cas7 group RAMP superfamily)
MFAPSKKVAPVQNIREVDKSFTQYARSLIATTTLSNPKRLFIDDNASKITEDCSLDSVEEQPRNNNFSRTGDCRSYAFTSQNSKNQNFFIDKKAATRMYRVLVVKETAGKKLLIDSLDGKIYCEGFTYRNRLARDVVLFDTKSAALSERFPSNQVFSSFQLLRFLFCNSFFFV